MPTNGTTACLTNNPGFVDASNGNFALQANSPCIDRGGALDVTNDIAGLARSLDGPDPDTNAAPDLGAYEYFNATGDSDEDGYSDLSELWLGTDPYDSASYFTLSPAYSGGSNGTNIIWFGPSVTGRLYTLEYRDSLLMGGWTNLGGSQQDVPGIGSALDYILDFRALTARYYRVRIKAP
jgi:hypothetical protein